MKHEREGLIDDSTVDQLESGETIAKSVKNCAKSLKDCGIVSDIF